MRWISFTIILLIAIILEAGNLLNVFAVGGWYIRPAILITLLVYYSFSCRPRDAIICSFVIGFAADLTGTVIGPHIICFGLLGLLLNQSNQILYARRGIYKAMIVFAVYLIAETFSHWLALLKGLDTQENFYSILLFTAFYSAVISPVIWSVLSSLSGGFTFSKSQFDRTYR
jgi:rod shape-determining protein MreD